MVYSDRHSLLIPEAQISRRKMIYIDLNLEPVTIAELKKISQYLKNLFFITVLPVIIKGPVIAISYWL